MASWICSTAATASGGAVRPSVIFAISVWRKRPESSSRKPSCISSATLRRSVSWAFMAASSSRATRLSRSRRLAYRKAFSTATEARSASEEARRRSSTVNGSPGWRVRFSTPSTLSPLPSAARGRQRLESMVGSTPSKRGSVAGPCRMKGWLCSATHPAMPSPRPIVDRIASGGSPIEQRISNRAVLGLRSMTEARLAPTASPASRRTRPSCRSRSAPFLSPRPTLARASRSRSERFAAALFDWVMCIGLCSILVTLVGTLEDPEEDPAGEPVWEPIRRFYTRRVMLTAGVDIGGTKVFAVLVDEDGSVCERASHPTDPEAGTASVVLALDQLIGRTGPDAVRTGSHQGSSSGSSSGPSSGPGAIGIAAAAYVAHPHGRIASAPNLVYGRTDVAEAVRRRFQVDVVVENDANAAAWAEQQYGAGRGSDDTLMLTIGTGIGGGVVVLGEVFRGYLGFAEEFGQLTLVGGGHPCACGTRAWVCALYHG